MNNLTPLQKLMLETAADGISGKMYRFFDVESFAALTALHTLGLVEESEECYTLTETGRAALNAIRAEKHEEPLPSPEPDLLRALDAMLSAASVVHDDGQKGFEIFFLAHLKPNAVQAVAILKHLGIIEERGGYVRCVRSNRTLDALSKLTR